MSLLLDTYCQLCGRFINKENWTKHLYSNRHLHKQIYGYWPKYFPNKKLLGDESDIIEKAFWKMFFATLEIEEVKDFWIKYFTITTKLGNW